MLTNRIIVVMSIYDSGFVLAVLLYSFQNPRSVGRFTSKSETLVEAELSYSADVSASDFKVPRR